MIILKLSIPLNWSLFVSVFLCIRLNIATITAFISSALNSDNIFFRTASSFFALPVVSVCIITPLPTNICPIIFSTVASALTSAVLYPNILSISLLWSVPVVPITLLIRGLPSRVFMPQGLPFFGIRAAIGVDISV